MKRIFKYSFPIDGSLSDHGAGTYLDRKFLSCQLQRGNLCLWYEVDDSSPEQLLELAAVPTGWRVPEGHTYRGTIQLYEGDIVLHIYEKV